MDAMINATTGEDDSDGDYEEEDGYWGNLEHPSHPIHPLKLTKRRYYLNCNACGTTRRGSSFMCTIDACGYLIHHRCALLPLTMRGEEHHHYLSLSFQVPQEYIDNGYKCDVCTKSLLPDHWIYHCRLCRYIVHIACSFSELSRLCTIQMHLRCAQASGMIDATGDHDEQRSDIIDHSSHPDHKLKLLRKRCSFKCDACGTTRRGSSYTCTADACQYLVHEKCASLPQNLKREDHHHSLTLSYHVPLEYIKFRYKCDLCNKSFLSKTWIYHCQICRFIVHIKCAFNKQPRITENIGKDIIHLPTNKVAEELITPFVMRQAGGETLIPPIAIPNNVDELVNVKHYEFLHHQHQLTLVSSGNRSQEEEEEEEEENYGVRSELICNGCITPISSTNKFYYMSCSECKYNLHLACFHLPPHLLSLPLHLDNHPLHLRSCNKFQPWKCRRCSICKYEMNGLFYTCATCSFEVDIKCACMPDTIHHAAHPRHLLNYVTNWNTRRLSCAAECGRDILHRDCYRCSSSTCDFIVHFSCAVLPASTTSRRWDKHHQLLLTYDATLDHPGDFYCNQCETQMNPKSWMYHCRACHLSFHPKCFPTTSGEFRNVKLGQEYEVSAETHPHHLTFQLLTTKRRCDICQIDNYEHEGFYCALCNFFICYYFCGAKMIKNEDMKAFD
ncbi:uncharacterized protein LOC125208162 [Salvia hispanica]|uniref:uncharacterized protein LOC125208162 n=1 Tax=Salvia hispanica TaxID=49212 RepID=UPI0020093849|nr:uncharacterized protein LOC125208162 [Salvia hispanica]